jgi:UDPglucose 6-dehydrogenase
MIKKISCLGMSHLGLVYSSVFSKYTHSIVCYDENVELISKLKRSKIEIQEPNLKKELNKNKKKYLFTHNYKDCDESDLIFISLDAKTNKKNQVDLSDINNIFKKILKLNISNRIPIIFLSQLPPGFCENISKKFKRDIYYQVETLVFGNAINRAKFPERIIVGSKDKKISNENYINLLKKFKCPIINMNYLSAELTKIAINIYLISTITTTNYLTMLSEKIDFDWDAVSHALRLDKRIGKYAYLQPSLGLAGGNLERDLNSLNFLSRKHSLENSLIRSWYKISNLRKKWIENILNKLLKRTKIKKLSILGLAYKENTNSIKNANSIYLINKFKKLNFYGYDPLVKNIEIKNFYFINTKDLFLISKVIIIANNSQIYLDLFNKNKKYIKNKIIIDPYNILRKVKFSRNNKIYSLGKFNEL